MCEKEPELKIAQQLVLEFYRILKTQNKSLLSSWFTRVHESGSAELRRVAAGMEADTAAICEAISSRWSRAARLRAVSNEVGCKCQIVCAC
ncbi:transposase [Escherichia coli O86:H34 str. 99-3124]|nr:transposase [Escherichia coli O86:H34 str. 99-3124]